MLINPIDIAMTLYEFNVLSDNDKYSAIWDLGVHLDSVIIGGERIVIYAIERFFVEVYYDADSNTIIKNTSFKSGHSLDKYSNIKSNI